MKNAISLLFLILFLSTQNIHAQKEHLSRSRSFEITIAPTSLLALDRPRTRLGIGFDSGNRMSYNLDIGTAGSFIRSNVSDRANYSFFEIRPEIKYYFSPTVRSRQVFMALEAFSIKLTEDITTNGSYVPLQNREGANLNYESATFNVTKNGLHLKLGFKIRRKKISFEYYSGVGFAIRKRYYNNLESPLFVPGTGRSFFEWDRSNEEADGPIFHATMGFKLGYIFFER